MIRRLKKLEVENFRAFGGHHSPVDLDADVVLIHGRNGSGKTSLLAAIEYAVTGHVEHLSRFESDYPDVLRHHGSDGAAKVRLWADLEGAGETFVERTTGHAQPTGGQAFRPGVRTAFKERCYLSQTHLSQLLHVYQSSSESKRGAKDDAPVVRFIRDFLDLDSLEATERGLHVVGHKSRLPKEFPQYAELLSRTQRTEARAAESQKLAETATDAARRAHEELMKRAAGLALADGEQQDFDALDAAAREASADARARAAKLSAHADALDRSAPTGEEPPPAAPTDTQLLTEGLRGVARLFGEALALSGDANPAPDYTPPSPSGADPSAAHAVLASEVAAWKRRIDTASSALEGSARRVREGLENASAENAELERLRNRASALQEEVAALSDLSATTVEEVQRRQALLVAALSQVRDDVCPVCDRDYSEVGTSLADHVAAELEELGTETVRLREQFAHRTTLVEESRRVERRAIDLETEAPADRIEAYRLRYEQLTQAAALLATARKDLSRLSEPLSTLERSARAHDERAAWLGAHTTASTAAAKVLVALASEDPASADLDPTAFDAIRTRALRRATALTERADELGGVRQDIATARTRFREAQQARAQSAEDSAEVERLRATAQRVQDLIDEANELRKAAARTTRSLIKRTFDEHLNALVDDLYMRLVRDERFRPRITSKGQIGSLTAAVNAFVGEEKAAEDIASLVSSANLNTAALSLFLALHLAEPTRPRTLVLDDPVQSMDDVHATNLAALFRSLAYHPTTPRQLVLAVHDKALFDYLSLELGPTKDGDALIEVEVTRESPDQVTVSSERRTWQPDRVRFGT